MGLKKKRLAPHFSKRRKDGFQDANDSGEGGSAEGTHYVYTKPYVQLSCLGMRCYFYITIIF